MYFSGEIIYKKISVKRGGAPKLRNRGGRQYDIAFVLQQEYSVRSPLVMALFYGVPDLHLHIVDSKCVGERF